MRIDVQLIEGLLEEITRFQSFARAICHGAASDRVFELPGNLDGGLRAAGFEGAVKELAGDLSTWREWLCAVLSEETASAASAEVCGFQIMNQTQISLMREVAALDALHNLLGKLARTMELRSEEDQRASTELTAERIGGSDDLDELSSISKDLELLAGLAMTRWRRTLRLASLLV